MTSAESAGAVIIPALLTNRQSIARLRETILGLPESFQCQILTVAQGNAQALRQYVGNPISRKQTLIQAEPLGKWPAVRRALLQVEDNVDWVIVLDGDAAFGGDDVRKLAEILAREGVYHAVGQRHLPELSSADEISSSSRVFVEAYFNTVVLLTLGNQALNRYRGFDIQCGLQGFDSSWLRSIIRDPMPLYGGEAVLFYESVKRGTLVASFGVSQSARSLSTYRVEQIVAHLLDLDFIKETPSGTFQAAVHLTLSVYDKWITDESQFCQEIEQLVLKEVRTRRGL